MEGVSMKACKKCGEEKPLDGFYKAGNSSGRDSTCKECRKARVRENRAEKIEYYKEYDRKRGMLPHRVQMREAAIYRGTKKYRKLNKIKMQAHNRVGNAIADGRLVRADACEECGCTQSRLHAHHDDYLRQLDVRWLCPPCHKDWHDKHGEAANANHEPLPQFHITRVS
jgi:hypothetical protein